MTDSLSLVQLDHLDRPGGMVDHLVLLQELLQVILQLGVRLLLHDHIGEEIVDQGLEERLILIHKLGDIHVFEDPHHRCCLCVLWILSLSPAKGAQDRQDVPETKVVVDLLGQLLLAPFGYKF